MSRETSFYLVANWKMHFLASEARSLFTQFGELAEQKEEAPIEVWVAAASPHLAPIQNCEIRSVELGVQNVHFAKSGAFTGEISVPMARDFGATFTLVGHSERRTHFQESEELLFKRTEGALAQGLKVIYCVGETLEQRENGQTEAVLKEQLGTIQTLLKENQDKLLVAYEPVWAIGTGKVATVEEISAAHQTVKEIARNSGVEDLPVLYGGSVKPQNIDTIADLPEVDGALVGGASLDFDSFSSLFNSVRNIRFK